MESLSARAVRCHECEIKQALGSSAIKVRIIKARAAYDRFEMVEDESRE